MGTLTNAKIKTSEKSKMLAKLNKIVYFWNELTNNGATFLF